MLEAVSLKNLIRAAFFILLLCVLLISNGSQKKEPEKTELQAVLPSGEAASSETTAAEAKDTAAESSSEQLEAEQLQETGQTQTEAESGAVSIRLMAIGDMLMHKGVSRRAEQADGTYDYSYLFEPIADELAAADIAVVNNEVIFGGNELGLMGYPQFNVRTELGDAEAAAGFDIVLSASNHTTDQGTAGVENTLAYWTSHPEVTAAGIHASAEEQNELQIIERKGIRVAILNFTYGVNNYYDQLEQKPYLVDLMNDASRDHIIEMLQKAENEADITVVFPHWGEEYQLHHNAVQESWAQLFAQYGADLIIGTHPHVLEETQYVTAPNGNTALCYYSLGNYTNLQNYSANMLGGMAIVQITKDSSGTRVSDYSMRFTVNHFQKDYVGVWIYYLENYTDELAAEHGINTTPITEDNYNINHDFPMTLSGLHGILEEVGWEAR